MSDNELFGKDHEYTLVIFHLDLLKKKINIVRVGQDMRNLKISPTFSGGFGLLDSMNNKISVMTTGNSTTSSSMTTDEIDARDSFTKNFPLNTIDLNITEKTNYVSFKV